MEVVTTQSADRGAIAAFFRWVLLTGNRLLVSLVILSGIVALFVVAGLLGFITVTTSSRVMWYLNGTVNGLLTLVPIAVGVNQIVLSQEFGSIQDLYDRRNAIAEFQDRVEQQIGSTVDSPYASVLFSSLLTTVSDTASELQHERAHPHEDGPAMADITSVARSIDEQATRTDKQLTDSEPNMLRSFMIMLSYDNSRHINEIRTLRKESPDLSEETVAALDKIEELFIEIDAARQFLKTVVVERQLARLSVFLIFTGIPAVTIAALGIFIYRDIPDLTLSHPMLVVVVSILIIVTLAPLVILGAYIMRVATIARQTAMYGPFIPVSD